MGTPFGSSNVAANAIDVDSPEFATQFGGGAVEDESQDAGDSDAPQEVPEIIQDMQSKTRKPSKKATASKRELAAAQRAKEKAAAAKLKEKEAKKALAEKAKQERADAREAAKKAKAEAKAAGPDLTGLIDPKPSARAKLVNVPVDALDGIDGGDPVEKSFVDNVKLNGILTPIRVRQYTAEDGEIRYNIVYGKRRSQAARALNMATIPAVVESSEAANDYIQGLIENYARSNNVIEEHRMVKALMDAGYELKQIAAATGMAISQVSRAANVGRLLPELQEAVEAGQMKSWSAGYASRLPEEVQRRLVDVLNETGKVTKDDVNIARRYKQHEAVAAIADSSDDSGQDMFDTPDTGDDTTGVAPERMGRTERVAAAVNKAREALALLTALGSKSDDENDSIALLTQVVENLTTAAG